MVLESLVVTVLNKFLGEYVENLDANQLKMSVWSGDVELKNLSMQASALDSLDLPVRLSYGSIGHLHLVMPFTDLGNKPVIATLEGVHIIVVPNQGAKYDAEKENKQKQDTKEKELARLEEARTLKRKQKDGKVDQQDDTFVEKMVTNIIRNLQVTVKDIHIRYEDQFTNRSRPFAGGVTLSKLIFQTVDKNWKATIVTEAVKQFNKLIELKSLSIYWNSGTTMFSNSNDKDAIKKNMQKCIADAKTQPSGFNYILEPIELSSQLKMNAQPERDGTNWMTPKIWLNVDIQKLGISIGKYQYQDILEFLEAQERFTLSGQYRKHRPPNLRKYKGHAKEWWKFAIACEREKIARRHRNWSWTYIKEHRRLVRDYKGLWVQKLTIKTPPKSIVDRINVAEKRLDVFNINVARQLADMEVDSKGLRRVEDQDTGWMSWMGFGGGANKQQQDKPNAAPGSIASQLENAMTDEEKAKMFDAIDYQENMPPTNYPKTYVERHCIFQLHKLAVSVFDDIDFKSRKKVVALYLNTIAADLKQRPSASAMDLVARIDSVNADGMPASDTAKPPALLSMAVANAKAAFFDFGFVTNGIGSAYDQEIRLNIQPTHVVYHAQSINQMAVVFRPPESVRLKALRAGAMSKFDQARELSTTGLQHAVETRTKLFMDIKLNPALIIVPEGGVYTKTANLMLLDMGSLFIRTTDTHADNVKTDEFKSDEQKREYLQNKAYDKFQVELKSLQVLYSGPNENWQEARKKGQTPLHILQPTGFDLQFHKSTITDVSLPQMKLLGNLPDVIINVSDERLMDVMKLALSIPTPPPAPVDETAEQMEVDETSVRMKAKMTAILEENANIEDESSRKSKKMTNEEQNAQMVSLELSLALNQVSLHLSRKQGSVLEPYLTVAVHKMGADLKMRTFDMKASAQLGDITLTHHIFKSMDGKEQVLQFIENPFRAADDRPIFSVEYTQANTDGPYFASKYKNIEQLIDVHFEGLKVNLHREALMELQKFQIEFTTRMEKVQRDNAPKTKLGDSKKRPSRLSISSASSASIAHVKNKYNKSSNLMKNLRRRKEKELVKMKVEASLGAVKILVGSAKEVVAELSLSGLEANMIMRVKDMELGAVIKAVAIKDPARMARYPNLVSLKDKDKEMLRIGLTHYNRSETERSLMRAEEVDLRIEVLLKQLRFVFLMQWVNRMLCWAHPFQAAAEVAAREAQEVASQASVAAVEKAKELTTKVQLNISLEAPLIVVPCSYRSDEALYLDLGNVSLVNVFVEDCAREHKNRAACIENLKLDLVDMSFSRAIFDKSEQIVAEVRILEPVSLNLIVSRNLDFDWYKSKPEMGVRGRLPLIKLGASQEDYKIAMKILSENMTEGTPPPQTAPSQPAHPQDTQQLLSVQSQVASDESKASDNKKKTSAVKLDMDVDVTGLHASLYTGSSNLREGTAARSAATEFARLEVISLLMKGQIKENEAGVIKVTLDNFKMIDKRKKAVGITQLMDKKAQHKPLVDISISRNEKEDQIIEARVNSFYLCFCPEFIAALSAYFVQKPEDGDSINLKATAGQKAPSKDKPKPSATPTPAKTPSDTTTKKRLKIHAIIDTPEIILVEDATQPKETPAAFMNFFVEANMTSGPEGEYIKAELKNLQLFSTYYDEQKRDEWYVQVLEPLYVILESRTDALGEQKVILGMKELSLRVSPTIIRLLSNAAAGMAAAEHKDLSQRSMEQEQTKRLQIWDMKDFKNENFWFLQPAPLDKATEALEGGLVLPPIESNKPKQILTASIGCIKLCLEASTSAKPVPLIQLRSVVGATVRDWSSRLKVEAKMTLQVSYYNELFSVWEPLVEPIEDEQVYRPWELNLTMVQNPLSVLDPDVDLKDQPAASNIAVTATDMLQMTVSKTTIDVFRKLGVAFERAARRKKPAKAKPLPGNTDYVIVNDTGLPLRAIRTDALRPQRGDADDLPHGDFIDLKMLHTTAEHFDTQLASGDSLKPVMMAVEFPTMQRAVREMNVARAETRTFGLPCHSHPGDQWQLVAQVIAQDGRKIITLRSILQVHNHLRTDIDIYYLVDTNMEYCGRVMANGENGDVFNIPLPAVYSPQGEFYFKPVSDDYETIDAVLWAHFKRNIITTKTIKCSHTGDPSKAYYIQVCSEMLHAHFENTTRKTLNSQCFSIHLRPPVTFHNLLPVNIEIHPPDGTVVKLDGGEHQSLECVCPGSSVILVKVFTPHEQWQAHLQVDEVADELVARTFTNTVDNRTMELGLRCTADEGSQNLSLYAPYWLVNNTRKHIVFRSDQSNITRKYNTLMGGMRRPNKVTHKFITTISTKKERKAVAEKPSLCKKICGFSLCGGKKKTENERTTGLRNKPVFKRPRGAALKASVFSTMTSTCKSDRSKSIHKATDDDADESSTSEIMKKTKKKVTRYGPEAAAAAFSGITNQVVARRRLRTLAKDPKLARMGNGLSCGCRGRSHSNEEKGDIGEVEVRENEAEPVMFSFRGNEFFQSNKACMRFDSSEWSEKFPMDTVGSAGRVICKANEGHNIDLSLNVTLSNSGLTKIVTVNPFYLINNASKMPVQVREAVQGSELCHVPKETCVGFWPKHCEKKDSKMMMHVKYADSDEESQAFPFTEIFEGLVTIPSSRVGVEVNVSVGEGSVVINIEDYEEGMAPALIINDSTLPLRYMQHGTNLKTERRELPPKKMRLFTWSDLSAQKRALEWAVGDEGDIEYLICDDVHPLKNGVYMLSFLNGRQRTLLFSNNYAAFQSATNTYDAERVNQEIDVNLEGIGLSLVNNELALEIAYVSMTSSGVVWEVKKNRRKYKSLTVRENDGLEAAYQQYVADKVHNQDANPVIQVEKLLVNFEDMQLMSKTPRQIRRTFQPGMWLQLKTSDHQRWLHIKLNKLQIDNQLPGSVFPIVVGNVPQSASVAADTVPKPLIEMSLVQNTLHGDEQIIKYFKVLTQEIAIKADQGFINAMLSLVPADAKEAYGPELFEKDKELANQGLSAYAISLSSSRAKMYYDYFHISPLMIHLSFSQGGSSGESADNKPAQIQSEFLNLFMKSVGVTLTEIQDVVLKLAYFERQNAYMNQEQLMGEITSHYVKQALKQLYVLVLGLDVLGNPFGLIRDLSSGVEDLFYEPFQGAIQGPEEFAEGLALGMRNFFGHTVGGVAGAATRITGTVGKGVAALTLDDDYQRKRQMALNRKPANVGEGVARGGKTLVMGVFDGITGIVTQPIKGAQQEGAVGLFKGIGKGVVGVVTRPVSGVVDGTSTIISSVKMAADTSQQLKRIRLPRYIKADKIIRPFRSEDAEGIKLLMEAEKGKYMLTDSYVCHVSIDQKDRYFLVVTDQRIMVIHKNDVFGTYDVEWHYVWGEMSKCPQMTKDGFRIETTTSRKRMLGLGKAAVGKLVKFLNPEDGVKVAAKVKEIYESF